MSEEFIIRTLGGPCPGDRWSNEDMTPWPLPDIVDVGDHTGKYYKVSESQMPPIDNTEMPNLIRGVQYEWRWNE